MTALNFSLERDRICFCIDTLAISPEDRQPVGYRTKFVVLPHIDAVIAGIGHGGFIDAWFSCVNTQMIVRDTVHLDQFATEGLRTLSQQYSQEPSFGATAYHFGFSLHRNEYVGYAYRSHEDFVSEELIPGYGIRPPIHVDLAGEFSLPAKFIEIMQSQRNDDLQADELERIGIGGDIHFVWMENHNVAVTSCHRFDSYESDFGVMCQRIET